MVNRHTQEGVGRMDGVRRSGGFTMLEMMVVIMLLGIMVSMVTQAFGPVQNRLSTRSAQESLKQLKSVARMRAVERGTMASLVVDVEDDRAWVRQDGETVSAFNFMSEFGVTLSAEVDSLVLCMSPRGYANLDCNSFTSATDITFSIGSSTRSVRISPMGRIN